jgi:hypothetical protein
MAQLSTFIIIEDRREFAPVAIRSEGLLIGSSRRCGLRLKDPSIPPALGGIREIDGNFYFLPFQFSPFSESKRILVTINGREIVCDVALAAGDQITFGQCHLLLDKNGDALVIRVTYSDMPDEVKAQEISAAPAHRGPVSSAAVNLLSQWIKRRLWKSRRKLPLPNPLEPESQRAQPGTEFNWSATGDLAPPWPGGFLLLCFLIVALAAVGAFVTFPSTFSPGGISHAHSTRQVSLPVPIASTSNSDSCHDCHALQSTIDQKCSHCHQAAGFHASITKAHSVAGITCINCHTEHLGSDSSPKAAAFASCTSCHSDKNKQTYNRRSVHTPHGGIFGYPTSGGAWIWKGLDEEALRLKPEVAATWSPEYDKQTWMKVQFHAIHLARVKVAGGITGDKDGSLSCSSCHQRFAGKFDRDTPRQTCAKCHNGYPQGAEKSFVNADRPNCVSCHVQHYYDAYRWGDLLTQSAKEKRQAGIDNNYLDAVKQSAVR